MIIGLNLDVNEPEILKEHITGLTTNMGGKVRIYEPKNLADYTATLKAYNPKNTKEHLILLKTHYGYSNEMTLAQWRAHEYFFDLVGGTLWGNDPSVPYTHMTYQGPVVDYAHTVATALWGASRSVLVRSKTKKYLGRGSTDPHTILVGYTIEFPSSSKPFDYLVSSLPETWWEGVGFIRAVATIPDKFFEHFDYVNYVSLGDSADAYLDKLGVEHSRFPSIPAAAYRYKAAEPRVGSALRNVAVTREDVTDWTFPS